LRQLIDLLFVGIGAGSLYAVSALGLVLVFRSSGVVNFAHGAIAMVGAYAYWDLSANTLHLPGVVAALIGVLLAAVLGYLVFLIAIRPLTAASNLTKVIATLGVVILLQQAALIHYGTLVRLPPSMLPTTQLHVGFVAVGADRVILLAGSAVLTAVLWYLYRHTRFGLATSAVAESPRSLAALGWETDRIRALNWTVGGALAGVTGVLLVPIIGLQTTTFTLLVIPSLAGALIGGMRSFPLTLLGGVLIGALQALGVNYISYQGVADAVPFAVIIVVLMLAGRTLPLRSHVRELLPRAGSGRINVTRLGIALVAGVFVISLVEENFAVATANSLAASMVLLSQVVVTGYAGQLSLAQLPLAGVGGLLAGRLVANWHFPFLLAVVAVVVVMVPVGILVGLPSLRARGLSLAVATLGLGVCVNSLILTNASLTGGALGITVPSQSIFGWSIDSILNPKHYAIACLAAFALLTVVIANLRRGRVGRRLLAVRTNERAAAALGINVTAAKLYAFTIGSTVAAVGGVFIVFKNPQLLFTGFDVLASINAVAQGVVGGIGYLVGPVIAAPLQEQGLVNWVTNHFVTSDVDQYLVLAGGFGLLMAVTQNPNGVADVIIHGPGGEKAAKKAKKTAERAARGPNPVKRALQTVRSSMPRPSIPGLRRDRPTPEQVDEAMLAEAAKRPHLTRGARLTCTDVVVRFGTVTAVDHVSLEVNPGEVVSVIGPNGAGKTTLMDAVTGFVPMAGEVTLEGRALDGLSPHRRARAGIARSFQSLELFEDMTVLDNLRAASEPRDAASYLLDLVHPKRGSISPATAAAIATLRLEPYLHTLPTDLPYGTRHLVSIARAIATEPAVLLLDEPAAGLDEHERGEVGDVIRLMAEQWRMSILLIEHDVALVARVSDRIIGLDFGTVIASGPPATVLADPAVIGAYLGHAGDDGDGDGAPAAEGTGTAQMEAAVRERRAATP